MLSCLTSHLSVPGKVLQPNRPPKLRAANLVLPFLSFCLQVGERQKEGRGSGKQGSRGRCDLWVHSQGDRTRRERKGLERTRVSAEEKAKRRKILHIRQILLSIIKVNTTFANVVKYKQMMMPDGHKDPSDASRCLGYIACCNEDKPAQILLLLCDLE